MSRGQYGHGYMKNILQYVVSPIQDSVYAIIACKIKYLATCYAIIQFNGIIGHVIAPTANHSWTVGWAGAPLPLPLFDVTFMPPTSCDSSCQFANTFDFFSFLLQLLNARTNVFRAVEKVLVIVSKCAVRAL